MEFLTLNFNDEQYEKILLKLKKLSDKDFLSQKKEIIAFILEDIGDKKLARQLSKLQYVENAISRVRMRYNFLQDLNLGQVSNEIQINKQLYVNNVQLILDKETCFRCDVSHTVCPKEAVSVERGAKGDEPVIKVDHGKCVLCGLCVPFCPSGCLSILIDDEAEILLENYQSLPILPDLQDINGVSIKRLFNGNINIDETKCPERCEECVWSCPTNAIERDGKHVDVDEETCVLCCACMKVCPEDAITIKRNRILTVKDTGFSAIWTLVIEKLLGQEKINISENAKSLKKIRGFVSEIPELQEYRGDAQ